MSPRSQPPRPTTSVGMFSNTRVPNTTIPAAKTSSSLPTTASGLPTRTINVKAVGRTDFRPPGKTMTAGKKGNLVFCIFPIQVNGFPVKISSTVRQAQALLIHTVCFTVYVFAIKAPIYEDISH